ncbi:hypothetical protein BVER_01791 [Candidatus Burkholderia verschuerenii]|uniref:Uncharacterized protein n=1 Tax=Candidatus Burkholderia verschuerenii TaxID=242163 RepID=A0A0L0MJW8_9BURK|nr:hypothetical protein [Candidatus Burkholderia verschuerenii]KND62324.1 hypothetical protein BVER_01791 [Candidatus Burkholderia verschuerenii]
MSEHDHFSANLDEQVVDEHPHVSEHAADAADINTFDTEPKKKRSIPTPVLMAGGAVLVIAVMFGYKHFFKAKPNTQFTNAPVTTLPADTGGMIPSSPNTPSASPTSPLPQQGTMPDAAQGSVTPLPSQANTGMPTGPVPTVAPNSMTTGTPAAQSSGLPLDMGASSPATNVNTAVPAPASSPVATAAPASGVAGGILNEASSVTTAAPAPAAAAAPAPDAKDAEIRKLKRELKDARTALAHRGSRSTTGKAAVTVAEADSGASDNADAATDTPQKKAPTRARHTGKHKHGGIEVQLGYHIKQVIPGQGWIVDEESGKQTVVAVGDKIGAAEVTRIDADNYKIYTTAGVIQ